jgi:hypothetical protein
MDLELTEEEALLQKLLRNAEIAWSKEGRK